MQKDKSKSLIKQVSIQTHFGFYKQKVLLNSLIDSEML